MKIVPINFAEACTFVAKHHRHHKPPLSHKFSIGLANDAGELCGVIIVGRPVSRMLDDGHTLEVTRLATDGTANACSMLYARANKVRAALGYDRLITYILSTEPGVSLRAAGWQLVGKTRGGEWTRRDRLRRNSHPTIPKLRYEAPTLKAA